MLVLSRHRLVGSVLTVVALSLAGCASPSGRIPVGFAGGGSCQSVRTELRKLDAAGVPGQIQAQQAGHAVSSDAKSRINQYNALLEQYLGNDCQLPPA